MASSLETRPFDKMTPQEALRLQHFLFERALAIVEAKRHDYSGAIDPFRNLRSSEVHGVEPWRGTLVRIQDKLARIRAVTEAGGKAKVAESMIDTFADVLNYTCILAGLVWEELSLTEGLGYEGVVDGRAGYR
jgi:hypothetical protein